MTGQQVNIPDQRVGEVIRAPWLNRVKNAAQRSAVGNDVIVVGGQVYFRAPIPKAQIRLGKTNAAHAKNTTGTIQVWTGLQGSETDSGVTVQAFNRIVALPIDAWVWYAREVNGVWDIISADPCP